MVSQPAPSATTHPISSPPILATRQVEPYKVFCAPKRYGAVEDPLALNPADAVGAGDG